MQLLRKVVTIRTAVNKMLRKPRRVIFQRLETGLVIETQVYGNKKIIKVYQSWAT